MKLQFIDTVAAMGNLAKEWSYSQEVALVPTMGFLHEGHLALVREAANHAKTVVVSIFVNPLQFAPSEDFERYPRDIDRDAKLLMDAGAHIVFMPQAQDITPPDIKFHVDPGRMGQVLCGKYRSGHFTGVSTIVAKLFNIIQPGTAVFGWKDAQQFVILRKMVQDLNVPIQLVGLETIREKDGLAMSSRNSYLNAEQRQIAPAIYHGLQDIYQAHQHGEKSLKRLGSYFEQHLNKYPSLRLQYIEGVTLDSLEPVDTVVPGNTLIAVAVHAGDTRLIDNIRL